MRILALGGILSDIDREKLETDGVSAVLIADSRHAKEAMRLAGMVYEGEIKVADVAFCKVEVQQECLAGALCIPKFLDVLGSRYKMLFFINRRHIVIIDDEGFAERLIMRIRRRRTKQGATRVRFLYNFITQFLARDQEVLAQYERRLMDLEEDVTNGKIPEFQSRFMPIRRELLTLRGYYDEMMDLGKQLEENENAFFPRKQLKYFGTIADRADRLMGKTVHLLEYAQQVRDSYQAAVDAQQNKNMQFLTVISTIFFPLTLITGWYGMNFKDMPGLEHGYAGVVILSLVVVIICILFFKKKKML